MNTISDNLKKKRTEDWGSTPKLTHEQMIQWLDGYRLWMFEIWKSNPESRKKWEAINLSRRK